jgi:hypothetical protein
MAGMLATLPLPSYDDAQVVVPAPGAGPGNWAGAASAVLHEGTFWLAYRVRRPLTDGRGVSVVVARSADGLAFEQVAEVHRESFGSDSFERPVLVPLPDGRWRLYLSCATPDSKHWWVDSLTAPTPGGLAAGERHVVLPGDESVAVKDPVISLGPEGWQMWLCCHPLTERGAEDRMTTRWLTSADGLSWQDRGEVLAGTPGTWDARGARVTAVLSDGRAAYDGRATAEEDFFERTGLAVPGELPGTLAAAEGPVRDVRYLDVLELPDGAHRLCYEAPRPDGSHELRTELVPPGS